MSPLAMLPMYDWPETAEALDRFWKITAAHLVETGIEAPDNLDRREDLMSAWLSPDLLIGQTCGWPYANLLQGKVHLFGCFDHGLPEGNPGQYYSLFIGQTPADKTLISDPETFRSAPSIAINLTESQSGFHVFAEITGLPAENSIAASQRIMTGSHLKSIEAVANGAATIAAVDAVSYELAARYRPELVKKVHVLGHSAPKPALPLITATENSSTADLLFDALTAAADELSLDDRKILMINGVVAKSDSDYMIFRSMAA